jgi:hypothetical protein
MRIGTIHSGTHVTASPSWEAWSKISTQLSCDLDMDELAGTSTAIQRRNDDGMARVTTLLRLSLTRGPGGKSLQRTAAWAHLNGLATHWPVLERAAPPAGVFGRHYRPAGGPCGWAAAAVGGAAGEMQDAAR